MVVAWNGIFNGTDGAGWTGIRKGQLIPTNLWSAHKGSSTTKSKVGMGIVRVVMNILSGQVQFGVSAQTITVEYKNSKGNWCTASRDFIAGQSHWQAGSPTGFLYLALAEAWWCAIPNRDELKSRWQGFIDALRPVTMTLNGFFSNQDLALASNASTCNEALMALVDSVYYTVNLEDWQETPQIFQTPTQHRSDMLNSSAMPRQRANDSTATFKPQPSLVNRLTRIVTRGENAILVGPSGTGKTESVKQAALHAGRMLVTMSGRPGLEDRDFFQGFVTGEHGFIALDGPLARAFWLAQHQPVCLLVNELMRFEPMYLGAFVGAMDTYSAEELNSMGVKKLLPGRYYLLEMPSSERLACLTSNLSIMATTNIGDDFQQLGARFDPAVMRRFGVTIEVPFADVNISRKLYHDHGAPPKVLEALVKLEEMTRHECKPNGLLERTSNLGVMLNLLTEAIDLESYGYTWLEALKEAATITIYPYCLPRTSNGTLEEVAYQALERDVQKIVQGVA